MERIRLEVERYINKQIIPQYCELDEAHGPEHIVYVIDRSIRLARKTGVDVEMAYVIAAYHDIGRKVGRERHGIYSAEIMNEDISLKNWFRSKQLRTMAQAIEDHSTSLGKEPRSLYGKILYQADKALEPEIIIKRAVRYGVRYYGDYSFDEQVGRVYEYINKKYGENGFFKSWIDIPEERRLLQKLRDKIKDKDYVCMICQRYYL